MSIAQYRGYWNPAALSFDGIDDYVAIEGALADISGDFTISMWIKADSSFVKENPRFFSLVSSEMNLQVGHMRVAKTIYFRVGNSSVQTIQQFEFDEWVHVAWSIASGTRKIYINGVEVSITNGGISANASFSAIGAGWDAVTKSCFKGFLDEIRFWNYARTEEEIARDMNVRLNGDEAGLVGYWRFDEGTGNVAGDSAGSNDGTIYGATWINGAVQLG